MGATGWQKTVVENARNNMGRSFFRKLILQ